MKVKDSPTHDGQTFFFLSPNSWTNSKCDLLLVSKTLLRSLIETLHGHRSDGEMIFFLFLFNKFINFAR